MSDKLHFAVNVVLDRYHANNPLRTADVHERNCGCMRCCMDFLEAARAASQEDSDEMQCLAKQEGVSETLSLIDRLTGGDGEYRYNTLHDPDRHCPDEQAMQERIVSRFASLTALTERVERLEKASREAIILIDEINKLAESRMFYGINQPLHAKLCTIRATIMRAALKGLSHG